jgi:hypothetical protein
MGKGKKQNVMVMLPGTKDVQDAILADPKRSALVDAIDVLQWQYRKDSTLYAPVGGQSLATRQYARIIDVGETSFSQIYRAVRELKTKYPQKAVIYSRGGAKFSDWAVFMGGGSIAGLPPIKDKTFFENVVNMEQIMIKNSNSQYTLGKKGTGYIIFSETGKFKFDFPGDKTKYNVKWINPSTGEITAEKNKMTGGLLNSFVAPFDGPGVAWLFIKH